MTTYPLSTVRRAGDLLFVSGQLGIGENGLVPGGVAAETRQAIQNVADILAAHGGSWSDVVKSTVFLASMEEWSIMNDVYAESLAAPYPTRSAVGAELIASARVEIEVVAYVAETKDES